MNLRSRFNNNMSISSMLSSTGTMSTEQSILPAKNYICPKCNKSYDFQVTGNNIIGRVPLILNCKHCICQECAFKMYPSKNVICGECHASNFITDLEAKKKPDQNFSINYYIIGALFCQKPCKVDNSNFNLKPAGHSYAGGNNRRQHNNVEQRPNSFLQFNMSSSDQRTMSQLNLNLPVTQNECCQEHCKKEAEVSCSDCDEIYCKQCSDTLHNSAKGLKKHKVSPLSAGNSLELKQTCLVHSDAVVEFHCEDCKQDLCCYCVLTEHKGHIYYQMTELNEDDMEEFRNLVANAEEILKKLNTCEKKGKYLYGKSLSTPANNTSIEFTISKKISNAITKLQTLEKEFLTEAQQYRNHDSSALMSILERVTVNIRSISNLISIGKQVLSKKNSPKKFNIHLISKQLKGACEETPCYLLQTADKSDSEVDFIFEDSLIDDLQHSSTLKFTKENLYSLVTEKDLPLGYEEDETEYMATSPKSMSSSASGFLEFTEKSKENTRFRRVPKTDSIERWIKTNNELPNKRHKTQKEQELTPIVMPILVQGDRETVKVSHLTSPDCFYVQLVKLNGLMNKLNRNIDKQIKSQSRITVQVPEINSLYLVKYIYDGQIHWCRGRLIEENTEQKVYTIFFIDYGNTGHVRKEDIIMMSPDLQKHAPLAIQCKFFDLYPVKGEWDPKALLLMTRIIANNELLMIVTSRMANTLEIDLITMDCDTSVRDALTFLGYGIPYCRSDTELDRIKRELKNTATLKLYNRTEQYKKEDSMEVIICYAIDPHNIYVNMKNSKNDLVKLHEAMHNFYKQSEKGYVYSPKKDMVVAVLYSDGVSSSWRRGVVTESTEGKGIVTARLVDIGMVYSVPWDQVRKLDGRFIAQDCQAKLVKLTDIIPPNGAALWPQNAIDYFTKYIKAETVLRMVVSETTCPPEVLLFECFPTVHYCLNATLVKEDLAESTGDLSTTVEWPQICHEPSQKVDDSFTLSMMKTIQASTNQAKTSTNVISDDEDEDDTKVWRKPIELISAESPDMIYVRFTDDKEKFHDFQLELKHFYSKNRMTPAKWEVGNVCVVYHKKKYYRGLIREVLNEDTYSVSLGDVAVTVEVGKKQLGVLDARFMKVPEFAMRCHLADITPAGDTKKWSAMSCEFLQDLFKKNNQLYLGKKGVVDRQRKSMPAVIWFTEFLPGSALESSKTVLHSVNKFLLKNGLALKATVARNNNKKEPEMSAKTDVTNAANDNKDIVSSSDVHVNGKAEANSNGEEEEQGEEEPVTSQSTEMEDHEVSSSGSASSVAGALKPSSTRANIDWNDLIEMQKQCSEQIVKDWLAPVQFRSSTFQAIPTFVNYDGEIFLHDVELEPMLRSMEEKMCAYFESRDAVDVDECWSVGDMCSVRYFVNKKWYRGKITSVNGPEIKVVMVDYGNEDDCDVKDLSKEILYYEVPIFANKVSLHDVHPKHDKWLVSDLDRLHAQIVDKRVTVSLKSQQVAGLATPAIINLDGVSINDAVLAQSLNLTRLNRPKSASARACSTAEVVNDSIIGDNELQSDNDVIIEETGSSNDDELDVDEVTNFDDVVLNYKQSPLPDLDPGEKFKVAVINVLDYNKIVFETASAGNVEKDKDLFDHISKEINFFVPEQEPLETFESGQLCIARYSEDGQWYRAQIIREIDDEQVYVWFVDFGNFENTSRSTMKVLQDEWRKVPVEQHLATIDGIALADQKNHRRVLDEVVSYCETVHMAVLVSKDPLRVKLYKEDGSGRLSYQNLIDAGLLLECAEKSSETAAKEEKKEQSEEEKQKGEEEEENMKIAEEGLKDVSDVTE